MKSKRVVLSAFAAVGVAALVACGGASDDPGDTLGSEAKAGSASPEKKATTVQCEGTAIDAATYIDVTSWGTRDTLEVTARKRESSTETFKVKSESYEYVVVIRQDPKSKACIIDSLVGDTAKPIEDGDDKVQCESAALEATTHVDFLGWGPSDQLKVISRKHASDGREEFEVDSGHGYKYAVSLYQDEKSEACVIYSMTTSAMPLK